MSAINAMLPDNPEAENDWPEEEEPAGDGSFSDPFALNGALKAAQAEGLGRDEEGEDSTAGEAERSNPEIQEGDFDNPAQQLLYTELKKHIRTACNVNCKQPARDRALEWIFVPSERDAKSLEFDPTCRALGARPNVVRARIQHQLWKASILLPTPLPFLAVPAPGSLLSEISAKVGPQLEVDMAREAWAWPSIPVMQLREQFPDVSSARYQAAIESLTANGYLAIASGRVYFISRNPALLTRTQRDRFSFSGAMFGEW